MRKKVEEFDGFGIDLSNSSRFKTVWGGLFTVIMSGVYIFIIVNSLTTYWNQESSIKMKYFIDSPGLNYSPLNFSDLSITGNIKFEKSREVKDLFRFFKVGFEYQNSEDLEDTKIRLFECNFVENSCNFSFQFEDKFFKYYSLFQNPKIIFQSCRTLKSREQKIEGGKESLSDCAEDSEYENFYKEMNEKILQLNYTLPVNQMNSKGDLNKKEQFYVLLFMIEENNEDIYRSDSTKVNVFYDNVLLSMEKKNITYINWISPALSEEDDDEDSDYKLEMIFSLRLAEEVLSYEVTKETLISTLVALGGTLKFLQMLTGIPNLWNKYYTQKALFQIAQIFKFDYKKEFEIEKENKKKKKENEKLLKGENAKEEEEKQEKEEEKEKEEEADLNIDWSKMSYCRWYFLTCCCNCSKKKKAIAKQYALLLKRYQCKVCIRGKSQEKWFDLSKLALEDQQEIEDLFAKSEMPKEENNLGHAFITNEAITRETIFRESQKNEDPYDVSNEEKNNDENTKENI